MHGIGSTCECECECECGSGNIIIFNNDVGNWSEREIVYGRQKQPPTLVETTLLIIIYLLKNNFQIFACIQTESREQERQQVICKQWNAIHNRNVVTHSNKN